jgi:DNA-binding NtrC family response regulator
VLLADPDEQVLRGLTERLRLAGLRVDAVVDAAAAARQLQLKIYDIAIVDVAFEQTREALRDGDRAMLVMVPSPRAVESWADELKLPVADLVAKPVSGSALVAATCRALEAARQARLLRHEDRPTGFDRMLGNSPAWLRTLHLAQRVACCDETVCLQGETGTGKSQLAAAIHAASRRAGQPLVTAIVPPGQAERQLDDLFGHLPGAYTGAIEPRPGFFRVAHRGTLFLDEVADLSPEAQFALLRALQDRVIRPLGSDSEIAVDVRVIVASNKDLAALVRAGRFREELYYRLNVLNLVLPPLRDRRDDILPLARHFAAEQARKKGSPTPELAPATEQALLAHPLRGNIRELQDLVVRGFYLGSEHGVIRPEDCGLLDAAPPASNDVLAGESLEDYLERSKRRYFAHLIQTHGGDRRKMAEVAGLHPSTLREKLKEYGQEPA